MLMQKKIMRESMAQRVLDSCTFIHSKLKGFVYRMCLSSLILPVLINVLFIKPQVTNPWEFQIGGFLG